MSKDDRYAHLGGEDTNESDDVENVVERVPETEDESEDSEASEICVTIKKGGEEITVPVGEGQTVDELKKMVQGDSEPRDESSSVGLFNLHAGVEMQRRMTHLGLFFAGAAIGSATFFIRNTQTKTD